MKSDVCKDSFPFSLKTNIYRGHQSLDIMNVIESLGFRLTLFDFPSICTCIS